MSKNANTVNLTGTLPINEFTYKIPSNIVSVITAGLHTKFFKHLHAGFHLFSMCYERFSCMLF